MTAHAGHGDQIPDLELVDRIDLHSPVRRPCAKALNYSFRSPGLWPPSALPATTPVERITLSTPAAKPSRRKIISPHGAVRNQRSTSQPRPAPTTTPATNSLASRKPWA